MKKLIIILTLLVGIIGCSKSSENKSFEKKIDDKQTVYNISENNVQNQNSNKNYETSLKKRIEDIQKEVQPGLDSGVTAEMNNAVSKQEELLEAEMKKVYGLLEAKLSDSEKARLKKEQEDWKKEVEKNAEEATKEAEGGTISGVMGGNTWVSKMEERALELAKRYDQLNNK
ncbi:lysozyme inhibitor LprI family protein [Leptotrichia sp. HSP-342]|uniref:Lysozyme inhibitor LprI family protein n=1 Tax=Leptotrichia mesophila TaxID=3239303 RepID=A0AB39V849_9FUSO